MQKRSLGRTGLQVTPIALGGAAFDVLSEEPPRHGNPLLADDIPRLIITPHNAWGSREARQRIVGQLSENARAFFAGAPIRVVNG